MATATVTISSTGTKTSSDIPFLAYGGQKIGLGFNITTLPTTLEVGFVNQGGTFIAFDDGAITATGNKSMLINSVPSQGIAINVTGGSPSFTVDFAGNGGPLSQ